MVNNEAVQVDSSFLDALAASWHRLARTVHGLLAMASRRNAFAEEHAAEKTGADSEVPGGTGRHVVILVENESVPRDRRVWQQSLALKNAQFNVTVICPTGDTGDREREAIIHGIRVLRFPLRRSNGVHMDYVREYAIAFLRIVHLAFKVHRTDRIDVLQACNPPDILFVVALMFRPWGTRFIFDQHDLVPELYASRFGAKGRRLEQLARCAERLSFATANAVISTNDTYRKIAIERGKVSPHRVAVVRNAPDLRHFTPCELDPSLRRGKAFLLAYLGVMGPQDGVEYALRAVSVLKNELGRDDIHCILMGEGDAFDDLVALASALGLTGVVEFTGWVQDDFIRRCLSSADVCLSPDPPSPLNNVSTMTKIAEYMAMSKPIVSFDLAETRVSAGEAAIYVQGSDERAFARAIDALLSDPERRRQMGELGRKRVEENLSWEMSSQTLIDLYRTLLA